MYSWIFRTAGENRKVWPTMITRPPLSAASLSRRHSSADAAMGFSTNRCLPASRTSMPSGKWVLTGVATTTASMLASLMISRWSVYLAAAGYSRPTCSRRLASRSAMATTSTSALLWKLRMRFGPQYPQPMTPILIMAGPFDQSIDERVRARGRLDGLQVASF